MTSYTPRCLQGGCQVLIDDEVDEYLRRLRKNDLMAWTVYDQIIKAVRGPGLSCVRDEKGYPLSDGAYYEAPLGGRFAEPGLPWVGEFKSLGRNKKTPKGVLYRTYHRIYFAEPHGPLPMVALVHYGVKQSHKREPGEQDRQIRKAMDKVGVLFDDAGWSYPTL
ncbi:hypothetical protein G6024_15600 [Dietzia maris]|nr:hypothetical protein [Dietzia maris]MBB0998489.1 hypothetical protein [Dietzia maris]